MKLPWLNLLVHLCMLETEVKMRHMHVYLLVWNIWLPPPMSTSPTPVCCSAQGGLQSCRNRMISLPASSTSGHVVLNLPARPTDKPQWWIRGVTIETSAYLLQRSGRFMWGLCICVRASFRVCVFLGREDGSHIGSVGVWCEWVFGRAVTGEGDY